MVDLKRVISEVAASFHPPIYRAEDPGASSPAGKGTSTDHNRSVRDAPYARGPLARQSKAIDSENTQAKTLARNAWLEQRTNWQTPYNVFAHLQDLLDHLKQDLYDCRPVQECKKVWEMYEVLGSAVGTLLHMLRRETDDRVRLERRVKALEEALGRVTDGVGGFSGRNYGGGR